MTPRPWRLTRRQRVAMETDLASLRRGVARRSRFVALAEANVLGAAVMAEMSTGMRIARARVAIALRAALRADEDARCEEAMAGCSWGFGDDRFYGGTDAAIESVREWPRLDDAAGRALWERVR